MLVQSVKSQCARVWLQFLIWPIVLGKTTEIGSQPIQWYAVRACDLKTLSVILKNGFQRFSICCCAVSDSTNAKCVAVLAIVQNMLN